MLVTIKSPNAAAESYESLADAVKNDRSWAAASSLMIEGTTTPTTTGSTAHVKFPPKLQVLRAFQYDGINLHGVLPCTIRSVSIDSCRLASLRDLICGKQADLEEVRVPGNSLVDLEIDWPSNVVAIDASDNALRKVCKVLPASVKQLDLSRNGLTDLPDWLPALPEDVVVNLSENNFWFTAYRNLSLNRHIDDDLVRLARRYFGCTVASRLEETRRRKERIEAFELELQRQDLPTQRRVQTVGTRLTAEDAQNVHTTSVQQSVDRSLDYILKFPVPRDSNYLQNMQMRYVRRAGWRFWRYPGVRRHMKSVCTLCADNTVHSRFGVTFAEVLERVWAITQNHEHRNTMEDVLWEEIASGVGYCFTGRFSRLVNALSGFVEEVSVGISEREQISDAVITCLRKCKEKAGEGYVLVAKDRVQALLKEYDVAEGEHDAWLDAI